MIVFNCIIFNFNFNQKKLLKAILFCFKSYYELYLLAMILKNVFLP